MTMACKHLFQLLLNEETHQKNKKRIIIVCKVNTISKYILHYLSNIQTYLIIITEDKENVKRGIIFMRAKLSEHEVCR